VGVPTTGDPHQHRKILPTEIAFLQFILQIMVSETLLFFHHEGSPGLFDTVHAKIPFLNQISDL
jgi:hypothetical protein